MATRGAAWGHGAGSGQPGSQEWALRKLGTRGARTRSRRHNVNSICQDSTDIYYKVSVPDTAADQSI